METFRAMIKSILRTSQHGQMKLVELEKDFKRTEGKSLSKTASEFGFASSEHLLKSFEELEVVGIGFNAMIICKQLDHIAKMNNFKK